MGDSSDNIPGVKGIGEKGAMDLVRKYKTLDGLYEHLSELSPKLREKLETDKDNAYMSLMLSKIVTDAKIGITLDELVRKPLDNASAAACFYKYGFRSQMKKWNIDEASVAEATPVVEETEEEAGYPKLSGKRPSILLNKDAASSMKTIRVMSPRGGRRRISCWRPASRSKSTQARLAGATGRRPIPPCRSAAISGTGARGSC